MSVNQPEILIVLPTLNEEQTIGRVIDEIPGKALEGAGYKVRLLLPGGSLCFTEQRRESLLPTQKLASPHSKPQDLTFRHYVQPSVVLICIIEYYFWVIIPTAQIVYTLQ